MKNNDIYITKGGTFPRFYITITQTGHTLIAGATGSGKSVLINNILKFLTDTKPPSDCGIILLDPKRVELQNWKQFPHCITHADSIKSIGKILYNCIATMEARYKTMQRQNLKQSQEGNIYIVIDELADLLLTSKNASSYLSQLAMLSRAANFHIIAGTQRPTRDIITPLISVNFTHKIALRTNSAQDSRNIIGIAGAEKLPLFGYGIIQTPGVEIQQIKIDILK